MNLQQTIDRLGELRPHMVMNCEFEHPCFTALQSADKLIRELVDALSNYDIGSAVKHPQIRAQGKAALSHAKDKGYLAKDREKPFGNGE